ncbi:MAG: hypothetical protein ACTS27_07735, partial [Phycisphaerales bacterium]
VAVGVFFVAEAGFGFGPRRNLLLGLVMGVTYIAGALGVGPALRGLAARVRWVSARLALGAMLLAMGVCASSMALARESLLGASAAWVIWPAIAVYSAAMGALWPIVESYVTGGRREDQLRKVVGWFNVLWSSGVVLAAWMMAPMLKATDSALVLMLVTGVCHVLTCGLLAFFGPYPAKEAHHGGEPHPEVYERLRAVFQILLPASYVLMYTLAPLVPSLLGKLGVPAERKTLVFSVFLGTRVVSFALFGWWQGWHGRWRTPVWTTGLMLVGFAAALLSPTLWGVVAGLVCFGMGLGGIYTCALYYAMEVGAGEVEAGGVHEALIGGGYTLGPLLGLGGLAAAGAWEDGPSSEGATVLLAGLVMLAALGFAVRAGTRSPRRP